jgi:hypothetical protein
MKIAILIPGILRFYKECYPNFNDCFLKPLSQIGDIDIFVHTWENVDPKSTASYWWNHIKNPMPEINLDEFNSIYKPKKIIVEDYNLIKPSLELRNFCNLNEIINELYDWRVWYNGVLHSTPQYYKIFKTNQLKKDNEIETGEKYDIVIKYRTEAICPKPIPVEKIQKNILYLSDYGYQSSMVDDTCWLGNSEQIDYMASIYNEFPSFYKNVKEIKHGFVVEVMMFKYLIGKYPISRLAEFGLLEGKFTRYGR